MINLLAFCFCCSLAITAIHVCITRPGMILNWIGILTVRLPDWILKPLHDCLICMASVWTITFWFASGNSLRPTLIMAILIVAGINTIICALLDKLTDYGC